MLTNEQALHILRGLSPRDLTIADDLVFCRILEIPITIKFSDFNAYLRFKDAQHQTTETSIFHPGYYEHAIENQSRGPRSYRIFRDTDEIKLIHEQSGFELKVSPISACFIMSMTDTDLMHRDFKRVTLIRRPFLQGRENITLQDLFARTLSVKVLAPTGHPFHGNSKQLRTIAESGLYHISFGYDAALIPIKSWERTLHFLDGKRRESVQFPVRTYNHELVAYYQMALSSESLILSFLALYKILEYFFTAASEHILHEKMKEQLVAPDFSHTKVGKLRELAKAIRKFDQRMDERRMLQTVFEQHIDKEKLKNWVETFDSDNSNYFTSERDLFGEISKIDTSENQIFPSIGNRIYHIRNALVHNKEGEISRFIPFSGQEKILMNEAPLLRKIAEELISKTGKDIQL